MKTFPQISALSLCLCAALALSACGGGDGDDPQPASNGWRVEEGQPVTLRFAARAGNAPVACGGEVVVNGVAVEPADMRFYISGVRLLRADGTGVPLQLSGSNRWQYAAGENSVSLIDLRQPAGACALTSQNHPELSGTAPAGEYVGVEMVLGGVPRIGLLLAIGEFILWLLFYQGVTKLLNRVAVEGHVASFAK